MTLLPRITAKTTPIPINPRKYRLFLTSLKKWLIHSILFSYIPKLTAIKLPLTPGIILPSPTIKPLNINPSLFSLLSPI